MTTDTPVISLQGEWALRLDRQDEGLAQHWYQNKLDAPETVKLPGSLAENGIGDEVTPGTPFTGRILDRAYFTDPRYEPYRQPGNVKFPCWLTPLKFYKGVAWYQREITIPADWQGKAVHVCLERVHFASDAWIDGQHLGHCDSLGTPHRFKASGLAPGAHVLTVRIDNRMVVDVGEDAHSMSDQSQGSWNGAVGDLQLEATEPVWISDVQVYPAADYQSARVKVKLEGVSGAAAAGELEVLFQEKATGKIVSRAATAAVSFGLEPVELSVALDEVAKPWDEFNPYLYVAEVRLQFAGGGEQVEARQFGFRHFEARGRKLYLNDRRIFLRGTLECAVFPLTGYPPTDREAWDRILRICKEHGLNHVRFHSWCPPRVAFEAADEAGIIFSVECSSWAIVGENPEYDAWLYREADAMLREFGNHPSFCMMLYGNEPYGDLAAPVLGKWVDHYKARDTRRLFSAGTAWPMIPENQFNVWMNPRIQLWDQNLDSRINARPPETTTDYVDIIGEYPQPVISHEIGQWCVYPNFDEIPKYTGILRAYNFEIFRDFLEASGQGHLAKQFLDASGQLQVLCYKEEIESALRTPGMGGFQLLDLHDFPGQGSALVGILDAFWDEKGYISPANWRRFCNQTVPLAKMPRRVYAAGDTFDCEVMLAHFAEEDLAGGALEWRISSAGKDIYGGSLPFEPKPAGELYAMGRIAQELESGLGAQKLNLEITLPNSPVANDWDIWVYPKSIDVAVPEDLHLTASLDEQAMERLGAGGKVLLMPDVEQVLGDARGQVPPGFSSIFWNTAWTTGQQPHTLGILCDPAHTALAHFPTDYHSNWQWWYVIQRSRSMIMNPLPLEVDPIVRVIDDWFTARRLGLVFECELGGGKLLVSSVDVKDGGGEDLVCRQLLHSLLRYTESPAFQPKAKVTPEQIRQVLNV